MPFKSLKQKAEYMKRYRKRHRKYRDFPLTFTEFRTIWLRFSCDGSDRTFLKAKKKFETTEKLPKCVLDEPHKVLGYMFILERDFLPLEGMFFFDKNLELHQTKERKPYLKTSLKT